MRDISRKWFTNRLADVAVVAATVNIVLSIITSATASEVPMPVLPADETTIVEEQITPETTNTATALIQIEAITTSALSFDSATTLLITNETIEHARVLSEKVLASSTEPAATMVASAAATPKTLEETSEWDELSKEVFKKKDVDGYVKLTFDDGPIPNKTGKLLDKARESGVELTFFWTADSMRLFPDLVKRALAEGHSVQTHGSDHGIMTRLSDSGLRRWLKDAVDAPTKIADHEVKYIRAPYGIYGPREIRIAEEYGLTVVKWTADSNDWRYKSEAGILAQCDDWGPGENVLGHDTWGHLWAAAWDDCIDAIKENNLGFTSFR